VKKAPAGPSSSPGGRTGGKGKRRGGFYYASQGKKGIESRGLCRRWGGVTKKKTIYLIPGRTSFSFPSISWGKRGKRCLPLREGDKKGTGEERSTFRFRRGRGDSPLKKEELGLGPASHCGKKGGWTPFPSREKDPLQEKKKKKWIEKGKESGGESLREL